MDQPRITVTEHYDGDPGDREVQLLRLGEVAVYKTAVGPMSNNCYLLAAGGEGLLIDAAAEPGHLLALAEAAGAPIRTVLTTHSHADHVGALAEVLAATGARHVAATLDAPDLPAPVDGLLDQGDVLEFGGVDPVVFILRGHTRGGACVALEVPGAEPHLFVGDSLFPGGVGKTESQAAFAQLIDDVAERVFEAYPDAAVVHPGHGADTTVGAERPQLPEWRRRGW